MIAWHESLITSGEPPDPARPPATVRATVQTYLEERSINRVASRGDSSRKRARPSIPMEERPNPETPSKKVRFATAPARNQDEEEEDDNIFNFSFSSPFGVKSGAKPAPKPAQGKGKGKAIKKKKETPAPYQGGCEPETPRRGPGRPPSRGKKRRTTIT